MKISKQTREDNTQKCIECIRNNDFVGFSQLLPESSVNNCGAELMCVAIMANRPECVQAMMPVLNMRKHAEKVIRVAILYGHMECLKAVLKDAPQSIVSKQLISAICDRNKFEVAKTILRFYDPISDMGSALAAATYVNDREMIDVLFPISPIEIALDYKNEAGGLYLLSKIDERNAVEQKENLLHEIEHAHQSSRCTKKM